MQKKQTIPGKLKPPRNSFNKFVVNQQGISDPADNNHLFYPDAME